MEHSVEMISRLSHANQDRASRFRKARRIEKVLLDQGVELSTSSCLDIGTGSGTIASYFSKRVRALTSVDVVDERRDHGFDFLQLRDERLPFPDGCFDIVLSNHVIEHVGNKRAHLAEIARVLKPSGRCYLATPNRWSLVEPHFQLPFLAWLPTSNLRDGYVRLMRKGTSYDVQLCSHNGLRQLISEAGLNAHDISLEVASQITKDQIGLSLNGIRRIWPRLRSASPTLVLMLSGKKPEDSKAPFVSPTARFSRQNYFLRFWRLGNALHRFGVPLLPTAVRIMCQVIFHADVPSHVAIAKDVVFMHNGLGTVIHTQVKFRGPAVVYHNVTIGMSHRVEDGAPTIGKNVLIGANAVILGPVDIGDNCIVAAGAVVTKSVPTEHMAFGNPAQLRPVNRAILKSLFEEDSEHVDLGSVAEHGLNRAA
jgi:serine acetyltransferase/2-polyprenyl-3-methyl-5-hydroxy-6-metoxy-1,4-benzoquinol methylase